MSQANTTLDTSSLLQHTESIQYPPVQMKQQKQVPEVVPIIVYQPTPYTVPAPLQKVND